MSYLTTTICQQCTAKFMGDLYRGIDTCSKCVKIEKDKKEAAHYGELDQLTLEQRIRRLEEISYRRSITPPRYIPSPLIGGN